MYNGWKNYETWNVALWIGNDANIYSLARGFTGEDKPYEEFAKYMTEIVGMPKTKDEVFWLEPSLDFERLNEMFKEDFGI